MYFFLALTRTSDVAGCPSGQGGRSEKVQPTRRGKGDADLYTSAVCYAIQVSLFFRVSSLKQVKNEKENRGAGQVKPVTELASVKQLYRHCDHGKIRSR